MTMFVGYPEPLLADQLVLKEGKTLGGTIMKEDAREYTILLGSNMVLRVDKDKVANVVRTSVPKPPRPTVRTGDLKSAVAASSSTATSAEAVAVKAFAPSADVERTSAQFDAVTLEKIVMTSTAPAEGPDPADIKVGWAALWDGEPAKEDGQAKWKWAVVRATITRAMPLWLASAKTPAADVEKWNAFLTKATAYSDGKIAIYSEFAESFAREIAMLRAADEAALRKQSAEIFAQAKTNAGKKQDGYERRMKKIFDMPVK